MTRDFTASCAAVNVNSKLISEELFDAVKEEAANNAGLEEYALIRHIFNKYKDTNYIKSHLAVAFQKVLPVISRIINHNLHGGRKRGRPRLLTEQQENDVIEYVRLCQRQGRCLTFAQATRYINEELLDGLASSYNGWQESVSIFYVVSETYCK